MQGALPGAGDAVLMGECTAFVGGGWRGAGCPVRRSEGSPTPGLSPQQGVLIQLPKSAMPVRMVLWSTSAQIKLIMYHEKAAVITGFEIHQNNPLRNYR